MPKSLEATPPISLITFSIDLHWTSSANCLCYLLEGEKETVLKRCHCACTGFLPTRWEVTARRSERTAVYPSTYTSTRHLPRTPTISTSGCCSTYSSRYTTFCITPTQVSGCVPTLPHVVICLKLCIGIQGCMVHLLIRESDPMQHLPSSLYPYLSPLHPLSRAPVYF